MDIFQDNIKNYKVFNNIICNVNINDNYINIDNMYGGDKNTDDMKKYIVKFKIKEIIKKKSRYIKISQNQLQILDSLLNDGSERKYLDSSNNLRYSEHSGLFDFNNTKLEKIIVSGRTNREDNDDEDILLPQNIPEALDYELMFHTHPPTPYPGARAIGGILYEMPSISDLYHFTYHYNQGHIQVSLIVSPEGIYTIRMGKDIKPIPYPNKRANEKMESINLKINEHAINKYGTDFSNHRQKLFYEKVAQDTKYIKAYSKMVKKYFNEHIIIQYKPREYDRLSNKWIIKNLYIKISPIIIKYC